MMSAVTRPASEKFVVLFDNKSFDPRPRYHPDEAQRKDPAVADVRVVLRLDGQRARVIVEIGDGVDAVGDKAWYRLDFTRHDDPAKNLQDARAAYEVIEDIVATLNRSAEELYEKLQASEGKVKQLEQRIATQALRSKQPAPPPPPDPLAREKQRFIALLELANSEGTSDQERLTAVRQANEMSKKYGFLRAKQT